MEQAIIAIIKNLELIEVRGVHAERMGACIKTLHEMLGAVRNVAAKAAEEEQAK